MKGAYEHTVDAKGRMFVPARLRTALGDRFTVTKGLDGCIAAYPAAEWDALEAKIRALPMSKARDLQRFFFAAAADVELDSQGRILLPAGLRRYAGIEREVVVIGAAAHAEIWDAARWEAYSGAITDDRIAAAMEDIGF